MIYFDVTKAGTAGHRSGLMRVSAHLADSLGVAAQETRWPEWNHAVRAGDWFLTGELFSEEERPGFSEFLASRPCRLAAIFHDAIPLKHPHITWPQSVARHPGYMKLLARFDRVWAVSAASRDELLGFWRWQGVGKAPPVEVLALGADFTNAPRVTHRPSPIAASLLCVGILEPRKNQTFLLDVCEELWGEERSFELHLVGRVNPHFGQRLVTRIRSLRKRFAGLHFHEAVNDAAVARLYAAARASVFPTIAEGCGLPLLESLWMGVPCVCSDLPVLRENAGGGGCLPVAPNDHAAWRDALRRILTDEALHTRLTREATTRPLPTWADAAQTLRRALGA
jgi:glycosyltransferase involved in cell wall biosynthesis